MRKFILVMISVLLVLSLCSCKSADTDSDYLDNSSQSQSFTEEVSSDAESKEDYVDFKVPADIEGLIDLDEKPYGENKVFYGPHKTEVRITTLDEKCLTGEHIYKNQMETVEKWVDTNQGIYLTTRENSYNDVEKWFFMHNGYLVESWHTQEISEILTGDAETGFECHGDYHHFYKDGRYEYRAKNNGAVYITGNYIMVSDHIMKLTRKNLSEGEEYVTYFFISNSGEMYVALTKDINAY